MLKLLANVSHKGGMDPINLLLSMASLNRLTNLPYEAGKLYPKATNLRNSDIIFTCKIAIFKVGKLVA